MSDPRTTVILLDNSARAIDGDFYPSRLEAQMVATERLARYLFSLHQDTRVAIGTIGSQEFGIRLSFTSDIKRITAALKSIGHGGGVDIVKGVRSAFLALRHSQNITGPKRILLFVGSPNEVTGEEAASLAREAAEKDIVIDVVVFGQELHNWENLAILNKRVRGTEFLKVRQAKTILSDAVLASKIGVGPEARMSKRRARLNAELANAVKRALLACREDQTDSAEIKAQLCAVTRKAGFHPEKKHENK